MIINREDLLRNVIWIQPGIATREFLEQSSCVVLKNGEMISFNDEISCRIKSGISNKITGVIPHKPLLTILQKLTEEKVEIIQEDGELLIKGANKFTGLRLEKDIFLPFDEIVDKPVKWKKLPSNFCDAVSLVSKCSTTDESKGELTCVHVHPQRLEATDYQKACRYHIVLPLSQPVLVRGESLKHVSSFGATEICETEHWLHFRGSEVVHSYRKYAQQFKDIDKYFTLEKGQKFVFPKGLKSSVVNAEVFSSESADENMVEVTLRSNKVVIKGTGVQGWHREVKKSSYNGPTVSFKIPPELLKTILTEYNECLVGEVKLLAKGENWTYVAGLQKGEKE